MDNEDYISGSILKDFKDEIDQPNDCYFGKSLNRGS